LGETRNSELGTRNWRSACPHQHFAAFIRRYVLSLNQFIFESFEVVIVEVELELQCAVRDSPFALE
jgi:hypothetical protein